MCTGLGWAALAASLAGTAVSYSASQDAAQSGEDEAAYNSEMMKQEAEDVKRNAADVAEKQRADGIRAKATQAAQAAASGFDPTIGSPSVLRDWTDKTVAADRLATLYGGADKNVGLINAARNELRLGASRASTLRTEAIGGLLGGAGRIANTSYSLYSSKESDNTKNANKKPINSGGNL